MMQVEEVRVAAAGRRATMPITVEHLPPYRGRDGAAVVALVVPCDVIALDGCSRGPIQPLLSAARERETGVATH